MSDPFESVPIDNKTAWLRVRRLSHSLIFQCGHPRGGCPSHCNLLAKIFDLACERLDAEPELPSTPVAAQGQETTEIDIKNLRFYADMARQFQWRTDVIHQSVVRQTLCEIADRIAERAGMAASEASKEKS